MGIIVGFILEYALAQRRRRKQDLYKTFTLPTEMMIDGRWYTITLGARKTSMYYNPENREHVFLWKMVIEEGLHFKSLDREK